MNRAFQWMLKLVEMRRDRSVSQSRRAQQELVRSRSSCKGMPQNMTNNGHKWPSVVTRR